MNTPGHSGLRHEVSTERRRAIAKALDSGLATAVELADALGLQQDQVMHLLRSMMYHFRIVQNVHKGRRGSIGRYRLTVPLSAALDVMGGYDMTTARDAFYELDRAMPRPEAIERTLALQVTPRRVELGIAP